MTMVGILGTIAITTDFTMKATIKPMRKLLMVEARRVTTREFYAFMLKIRPSSYLPYAG